MDVGTLLERYARLLMLGGLVATAAALAVDLRWLQQPIAVILLTVMVLILRAVPIRLSKYSYLTQTGIPVLVGAVTVGPAPVVLALYLGVLGADVVWLRKLPRAGVINAGREVLGFMAAFGPYAAVHYFSGVAGALAGLPAGRGDHGRAVLLLHPRALLLHAPGPGQAGVRGEDPDPPLGDHLLPAHAHRRDRRGRRPIQTLAPVGWVAVGLALGVLGLLTRKIIEEAIGAEDLNKVHLMETAIASNATLQGSFDQIERLAYRLLDWGDFRIYRLDGCRAHPGVPRLPRPSRSR